LAPVPASSPRRPRRPALARPATTRIAASSSTAASNGRSDNVSLVYDELRGLIVWGQLPPGARIAERAVAERLGLSRTPVRSALHRLQQEGFVASVGRGADQRLIVAPLTAEDGREVFLIVGHLEGLAARMAAELPRPKRDQIVKRLRTLNKELGVESRRQIGITRIFDLDMEFHRAYVEHVAGPRVVALHQAIKPQTERYVRLYVSALLDELPKSVKEHDIIVRAIARGDGAAAQRAVETNWHNAADRLAKVIAEHGERGIWHSWNPVGLGR
jgi:DNA-binding GntR family transcriptional regulator